MSGQRDRVALVLLEDGRQLETPTEGLRDQRLTQRGPDLRQSLDRRIEDVIDASSRARA